MNVIFLMAFFLNGSVPINVQVGDPIIDLPLVSLENGAKTNLKELFDDGLAFILSPECQICVDTLAHLEPVEDEFATILIFVGDETKIRSLIKTIIEALIPLF